jgi:hypothetical protein
VSEPVKKVLISPALTTALDASGIPEVALEAYKRAAATLAVRDGVCHLPWQLLAAIGRVESDNGQFGGAVLLPDGYGTRPIYGIPLDGRGNVALVRATSYSIQLDGDPNFERAVGPMQFLPSTWALYGADGNGDGKKDPNNIFDSTLAAADYLCAGGGDIANPAQEAAAVLRYNDADEYVHVVLALAVSYEHGDFAAVPTAGTPSSPPAKTPTPHKTPTRSASQVPSRPPTPQVTVPPSTTTAAVPTVNPTATPTESPSVGTATTAPVTLAPTGTTETGPTPSGPVPSATPPWRHGQTADIGWAPAMRQVVVKLLSTGKGRSR